MFSRPWGQLSDKASDSKLARLCTSVCLHDSMHAAIQRLQCSAKWTSSNCSKTCGSMELMSLISIALGGMRFCNSVLRRYSISLWSSVTRSSQWWKSALACWRSSEHISWSLRRPWWCSSCYSRFCHDNMIIDGCFRGEVSAYLILLIHAQCICEKQTIMPHKDTEYFFSPFGNVSEKWPAELVTCC